LLSEEFTMNKWLSTITVILLMASASLAVNAGENNTKSTSDQQAEKPSSDPSYFFPPKMQSFRLYGDAAIPNSKPTPDEETGAGTGWIQKVSQPYIQVYLPAKVKATGASVV